MSIDLWKFVAGLVVTLVLQVGSFAWLAGGIEARSITNKEDIEKLEKTQKHLSDVSVSNSVTIKYTAERIDDVYAIVIKLWERDQ